MNLPGIVFCIVLTVANAFVLYTGFVTIPKYKAFHLTTQEVRISQIPVQENRVLHTFE